MKRSCLIITLLTLSMLFTGCSNENSSTDKTTIESLTDAISIDDNEIKEALNLCTNFNVSQDIYISIPETTAVYEYTSRVPSEADMKNYSEGFFDMFEYLFPGHDLDKDYLIYMGGSLKLEYDDDGNIVQNYNKVNDWYDKIISGEEGRVNYIYDETRYLDMIEWKSPVCLELGNPIGYGYTVINKGKTVGLNGSMVYDDNLNAQRYPLLESYDPADWLEYVGTYSPDSAESFTLLDGEIPINEAVDFFEEYINALPYPKESNTDTCVIEVDVLKVTENIYGYYFLTTKEYKGVPFDHMRSGTEHSDFSDYSTTGGNAFMIESDDIDIVYGYYRLQTMESINTYTDIVSFENAAKIISEKLSDSVEFEVQKIELIYTEKPNKTSEGYIDTENYCSAITPAWKFTLYNPNDNLTYVCYIDACDGENFRYYKTPDNLRLIQ